MQRNLLSRAKFAELAGVNPSTVTRLCSTQLEGACVGKQIDADHPVALDYLEKRQRIQTPPPATGLDPLYEQAVALCGESGRWTANFIQRNMHIGYNRAKTILASLEANGVVPANGVREKPEPSKPAPATQQAPKPKGGAAVLRIKKQEQQEQPPASQAREVPENMREFADWTLRDLVQTFATDVRFYDWLRSAKVLEDLIEKQLKNEERSGELIKRDIVKSGVLDTVDGAFTRMLTDGAKTIGTRAHALAASGAPAEEIERLVATQLTTFIRPTKTKMRRVLENA